MVKLAIGSGVFQAGATETARALVTGFLLSTLVGESKYDDFAEADATAKGVTSYFGEELAQKAGIHRG